MSYLKWDELPIEIQNKMLERQAEQNNGIKDENVFIRSIGANNVTKGFTWDKTIENYNFWQDTLKGNFEEFYKMYPKELEFKPIAMKCSKEQFNSIKEVLLNNGFKVSNKSSNTYLTNNYKALNKFVGFTSGIFNERLNRVQFEEWDAGIFLEYCGISEKIDDFIVPEYWAVKGSKEVIDYFNKGCNTINRYNHHDNYLYFHFPNYITENNFKIGSHISLDCKSNYTEITQEQFLTHIYNKQNNSNNMITYKVKEIHKNLLQQQVLIDSKEIEYIKSLGLLSFYNEITPVQIIKMGVDANNQFELRIEGKQVSHKNDDITEFVKEIANLYPKKTIFDKYEVLIDLNTLQFTKTGCENVTTSYNEWLNIYNLIK